MILNATTGGMYRSDDAGGNWVQVNATAFFGVASYSTTLAFAISTTGRVFKSVDSGTTWADTATSPYSSSMGRASIVKTASGNLIIGVWNSTGGSSFPSGSVYVSSDLGASWILASSNPAFSLSAFGTVVTAALNDPSPSGNKNFMKSTDSGATWSTPGLDPSPSYYLPFVFNGSETTYYMTGKAGPEDPVHWNVWKTVDGGSNWSAVFYGGIGFGDVPFGIMSNGSNVITGIVSGLILSTDGGTTWGSPIATPSPFIYIFRLYLGKLYACGNDGLYVSSDFGASWSLSMSGASNAVDFVYGRPLNIKRSFLVEGKL